MKIKPLLENFNAHIQARELMKTMRGKDGDYDLRDSKWHVEAMRDFLADLSTEQKREVSDMLATFPVLDDWSDADTEFLFSALDS